MTADHDAKNGEYLLNGRRFWPSNSGGWDLKGANVNTVLVRTDRKAGGKSGLGCVLLPCGTPGVTYEKPINKIGRRLNQNNSIVYENCRVPEENAFAIGGEQTSRISMWPVAAIDRG